MNKINWDEVIRNLNKEFQDKSKIVFFVSMFVGTLVQFIHLSLLNIKYLKFFSTSQLWSDALSVSPLIFIIFFIIYIISELLLRKKEVMSEVSFAVILTVIVIVLIIFFVGELFIKLPKNFINKEYVCKDRKKCEIKYFNDKYIFIKFGSDDNRKVEMLKFDSFFE